MLVYRQESKCIFQYSRHSLNGATPQRGTPNIFVCVILVLLLQWTLDNRGTLPNRDSSCSKRKCPKCPDYRVSTVLYYTNALRLLALRGCEHFLSTLGPSALEFTHKGLLAAFVHSYSELHALLLYLYRAYVAVY